jgi:RimJ/RimL family protein N-acetyltransferase
MLEDHWPLFGLRIGTPRLELRLPSLDDLATLADLAAGGVHDPAVQPFIIPWTDAEPAERARSVLQYQWHTWASWRPQAWALELAVVAAGQVIGVQAMAAQDFGVLRQVSTGSWLGLAHQGQGFGTEMRAAILDLAFVGLGAEQAVTAAFSDNHASQAVSRKLGYEPDGQDRRLVRGHPAVLRRLRLTRVRWAAARTVPVTVTCLEPCLPLFGG